MTRRSLPALASAPLAAGTTTGVLGILGRNGDLTICGIFLVVIGLPLLLLRAIRQSQEVTSDQIAQAHNNGYRLALDHVARGLLDQEAAPSPTPGVHAPCEQAAGNVIPIRPETHHRPDQRKAQ